MIDINTLVQYIDSFLESSKYKDACFNGLQVEGTRSISKIATTPSCTQFAIEQAVAHNADVLLVHHGLFWENSPLTLRSFIRKRVALLLKHGIHLVAYHQPLDVHKEVGNNWGAAKALSWENIQAFCRKDKEILGVYGTFPEIPFHEFLTKLETFWNKKAIVVDCGKKEVSSCAFISGKGHHYFQEAIDLHVDCFMTGTRDEAVWSISSEENIHFLSFGHITTEKLGVRLLGDHLSKTFSIEHIALDDPNPF